MLEEISGHASALLRSMRTEAEKVYTDGRLSADLPTAAVSKLTSVWCCVVVAATLSEIRCRTSSELHCRTGVMPNQLNPVS